MVYFKGMGSYMHVLPDSKEGDTPIYSLGASFYGGIEPAGAKIGYMNRPFGKWRIKLGWKIRSQKYTIYVYDIYITIYGELSQRNE